MSAQGIPTTVQNPIALNLSASYGALIIAAYISCALWGINVMQTYIYYWKSVVVFVMMSASFPVLTDSHQLSGRSLAHKVTVKNRDGIHQTFTHDDPQIAFLLTVDTAHKILVIKVRAYFHVYNWGRVSAILASPQEALHEAWVGSIIIVIVQLYYLRRLAKFASTTRHAHAWYLWLVFVILVALSVLQVPVTVAYCVFSINKPNIFIPINLDLKRVGLVASVVVDFVIAVAMLMLLKDTDSVDGAAQFKPFRRCTKDETASGTDFWTAIAQYPQCSIYFSTFLANLNARHFIRGSGDDTTVSNMEDIRFANTSDGLRRVELEWLGHVQCIESRKVYLL
ncbi:hypothetical protein HHX47_DHR1000672 [Lentinula edodes]|nr:hypothetical protein HHX47_DHR1000672 [Lentinula edodes]